MGSGDIVDINIDKKDSRILKGIAIIGMFILHFWAYEGWLYPNVSIDGFLPKSIYVAIGAFGNFCVSLFAFLTGYSFFAVQDKWKNLKTRIKNMIEFLVYYWIYEIIFLLIGISQNCVIPDFKIIILNMFGIKTGVGMPYVNVPFAWYVSFYLFVILIYPLFQWLMRKPALLSIIIALVMYFISIKYLDNAKTIISVFGGFLYAKCMKEISIKKYIILELFLGFVTLLLKIIAPNVFLDFFGLFYTFLIVGINTIVKHYLNNNSIIKGMRFILQQLGIHSMGMWYISGMFFVLGESIQKIVYFHKEPFIIVIWAILFSFIIVFLIDEIFDLIKKKLKL